VNFGDSEEPTARSLPPKQRHEARRTLIKMSVLTLPFSLGTIRTDSVGSFLSDLLGSSSGTVVMTVIMMGLLVLWRSLIDDSEDHENFVEKLKEEELEKKWAAHDTKWGIKTERAKSEWASTAPLPETTTRIMDTTPYQTKVTIVGDLKAATTVILTYHDVCLNHRW
jgi:hypothetical protein